MGVSVHVTYDKVVELRWASIFSTVDVVHSVQKNFDELHDEYLVYFKMPVSANRLRKGSSGIIVDDKRRVRRSPTQE